MKKIYLALLFCLAGFAVIAQTAASYTFSRANGTYTSIVGGSGTVATTGFSCDDCSQTGIPIGFTFTYCGATTSTLAANSNGWLSLVNDGTVGSLSGSQSYVTPGKLMPYWGDDYGVGSTAYYQTSGTTGSRVFTIEWYNWNICCGTGYNHNYQVKLFEGSNIIQFCYGSYSIQVSGRTIGIGNSTTDFQVLPIETSGTTTTTFGTGCSLPSNGTVLQWSYCNPVMSGGTAPFCAGTTTTLTNSVTGGTWSSGATSIATVSSTGVVTGVSAGTATISYLAPCGTTATRVVTINALPVTPSGSVPVCVNSTIPLTDASGAGTWTSSNTAIATVGLGTGVVTGVSNGNANITFTLTAGGCQSIAPVTVNPLPSAISGIASVCPGATTTLSDATPGGAWSSSDISLASVGAGTGVVTGVNAGTPIITYTAPVTGCIITTPITVYVGATPITGTPVVCPGLTTTLSNTVSGTWNSGSPSIATIGAGSGVVTGISGGTSVITYSTPSGCNATVVVTVNPNPATPGGAPAVCTGLTALVTDATPGGTWASSNTSVATIGIGTGIATGITAGTVTLTYTLGSTGCRSTTLFVVNNQPGPISGAGNVCVGANVTLADAGGGSWGSGTTAVATVGAGTGVVTGVTPGSSVITYTLPTGCNVSVTMVVNPLPIPYAITGGGAYCSGPGGVHVGLTYSNSGVNYQLRNGVSPIGPAVAGSNSGLDFGAQTGAGVYTVTANNPLTGCNNNMIGSVTISINPLPFLHNITGGGNVCIGGTGWPIGLDGSDIGIKYQLYNGLTPVGGLVSGTGSPINFGIFTAPGTYTVVAINNSTGCTNTMLNTAVISINPLPAAYLVTGGGSYCIGGPGLPIFLSNSDPGLTYTLMLGSTVVSSVSSVGGAIVFGAFTAAGCYTVIANDPMTGCSNNMTGSACIVINPLPTAYAVTGGGQYCAGGAGLHVGLSYSNTGVMYYLYYLGFVIDSVTGSGTSLDFGLQTGMGTYTVTARNLATGCIGNMAGSVNININPLPFVYNVTGGGNYCFGDAGVQIGTDFSDVGINYQLYRGTTPVGLAVAGTGANLNFGYFTTAGIYSVVAKNAFTNCTANMANTVTVGINPLPVVNTVTGGGTYCSGGAGVNVYLNGSNIGTNYDLMISGVTRATVPGDGSALNFGPQTGAGVYTVSAWDATTNCRRLMAGSAIINVSSLPIAYDVVGGGIYCDGGTGVHVGLSGSSSGISYQLMLVGSGPTGSPRAGTGAPLDFGMKTIAGTYTVTASNSLTGCANDMNSSANVAINALPNDYPISTGGNYCNGDPGMDINIPGSDVGVIYQLYRGLLAEGPAYTGIGDPIDFGNDTNGVYTVLATDPTTTCSKRMPGSSIINKIIPVQYTVTGGGNYCDGGSGVSVILSGSQLGWTYQLYIDGVMSGAPMAGAGTALNFGLQTIAGVYTVVATNDLYSCVGGMTGSVTVGVNPLPPVATVTGGGTLCAGGTGLHVGLDLPATGINYQLYRGGSLVGTPVSGTTGTPIDFGTETVAGTYTVVATDAATACNDNMAGSATITIKPLPATFLTSIAYETNPLYPGYYCAADSGLHIFLPGSEVGVDYQLWRGTTMIGSAVSGTGSSIDLGLQAVAGAYTIVGTDVTSLPHCSSNMLGSATVHIIPLPAVHNVTGGGSFCPGGVGVHVGLDASDPGIVYKLLYNGVPDSSLAATGAPLDFGLQTMTGTYTVVASSTITYCPNNMFGSAVVANDTIYTPTVALHAYPGNGITVWHIDSIAAIVTNGGAHPTFQWFINGHMIAGATNQSFTHHEFFNNDSVSCQVTASGPCGGNTTSQFMYITLHAQGVNVSNVTTGSQVILVPNPNRGTFTVKGYLGTSADEELSLEVTNMLGQVVYTNKVMSRNGNIDEQVQLRNNIANGMYLLNLRSGTQNTVFHFVIEQ